MYSHFTVVSACFLALSAFASAAPTAAPGSLHALFGRQSSTSVIDKNDIPQQCQGQCSGAVSLVDNCSTATDLSCVCSTSAQNDLVNCFDCLVGLEQSTQSQVQSAFNSYQSACKSAGVNLPAATIKAGSKQGAAIPKHSMNIGGSLTIGVAAGAFLML